MSSGGSLGGRGARPASGPFDGIADLSPAQLQQLLETNVRAVPAGATGRCRVMPVSPSPVIPRRALPDKPVSP
jgi:hypothetical protein